MEECVKRDVRKAEKDNKRRVKAVDREWWNRQQTKQRSSTRTNRLHPEVKENNDEEQLLHMSFKRWCLSPMATTYSLEQSACETSGIIFSHVCIYIYIYIYIYARPTSLHEALRLAMEIESYNVVVPQNPSIRAMTVPEDSASNEKAPEYEQLKETLLVVAEGVQKLLLEKRAAPLKEDLPDVRNAAKCWHCGKVGHFRRTCRQSPRQTE